MSRYQTDDPMSGEKMPCHGKAVRGCRRVARCWRLNSVIAAVLIASVAGLPPVAVAEEFMATVSPATYQGWSSQCLSNGLITLQIVPEIGGRVLQLQMGDKEFFWVVQRFEYDPERAYPDNASVEFWHNGVGKIHAFNRDIQMKDDPRTNPFVFESELLSPYCELDPGETCSWRYAWCTTNIGGDLPVLDCTAGGVVAETLNVALLREEMASSAARITGRFGVFAPGSVKLRCWDAAGS